MCTPVCVLRLLTFQVCSLSVLNLTEVLYDNLVYHLTACFLLSDFFFFFFVEMSVSHSQKLLLAFYLSAKNEIRLRNPVNQNYPFVECNKCTKFPIAV